MCTGYGTQAPTECETQLTFIKLFVTNNNSIQEEIKSKLYLGNSC